MGGVKFKMTNQRAIILEYLKENYNHPSVEEIFSFVKSKLPQISKKTVYSNLQFLCAEGFIQDVRVKGVQRYEPKSNPHHHLICRKCGRIIDIQSEELLSHAMKVGKTSKNFYVESTTINFYGMCKKCKEVNKNERKE
ncbi:MAG TPA: transcriptional repressor [Thermoplasmata archaeon]|nr:transcriptional repressor [Thermoplasmata archaeon]